MKVTKLSQMLEAIKSKPKKRVVVAYGQDPNTIAALTKAVELGIIDATLVGDEEKIKELCQTNKINPEIFEIVNEKDEMKSGIKAVDLINEGKGDFIMKGLISTDKYMRAILNKEKGLLPPKATLTHVTVVESQYYHKLLLVGDVAIIPYPELPQKAAIINYLVKAAHSLGIETPKVAIITATEKANPKMPPCVDAAVLAKMNDRGQIKKCIIDGPLALDVAIDKKSAEIKGLKSEVAGDADCLLFPNIEAGNVFYKSMTKLAGAEVAAVLVGAKVPAILSSRGDSENTKLYSIALAALTS
ncbi:MAG: phosphate butyryltransferase [Candidatus Cloacimonadota bacterium]|nr:MAG: phosphate butyryltransferase [Candidatus Cloacimonadota bacterium]